MRRNRFRPPHSVFFLLSRVHIELPLGSAIGSEWESSKRTSRANRTINCALIFLLSGRILIRNAIRARHKVISREFKSRKFIPRILNVMVVFWRCFFAYYSYSQINYAKKEGSWFFFLFFLFFDRQLAVGNRLSSKSAKCNILIWKTLTVAIKLL